MNTSLAVTMRTHLEDLKTDREYIDVFPNGILNAGSEILINSDMRIMANRSIFQIGWYQNRPDFVLHDLYREIDLLDMRYRTSSGDMSDLEENLTREELHELKMALEEFDSNSLDQSMMRDDYIWDALYLVYSKAQRKINRQLHADSMLAICRLALKSGYRIIIEDSDLTSFGSGVFSDMFEKNSPEEMKSVAIVSKGLSFKVILNDAQITLPCREPISERIRFIFPEAETVSIKIQQRTYRYE